MMHGSTNIRKIPETCRISCQNKFVKLVHLIGFIIKKFVTMQRGHVNVKFVKSRIYSFLGVIMKYDVKYLLITTA
jgi:hypothetical protein